MTNSEQPGSAIGNDPAAANIADLVRRAADRGPDHPALVDVAAGRTLSWAEVDAATSAEARRLRAAGAEPGDRVALRLPTGAAFAITAFGAFRAGCVVVPIGPGLPAAEVQRVLADSAARLLVTDRDPADDDPLAWSSVGTQYPIVKDVTLLSPPDPQPTDPQSSAQQPDAGEPDEAVGGGADLAVLAYTSGTSGVPRGVMLSHRALLANCAQCADLRPAPVTAADRLLLALPLFHIYGLGPGLLQVAAAGATAVLVERFDPAGALDLLERHRITSVAGVPPMYEAWSALPAERLRAAFATVRLLTSGAAPLSADLLDGFRAATGLDIYEGYGLTETGPVLTWTLAGGHPKPGSVGRPLPGVEVALVDTDGRPLPDTEDLDEDITGTGLVAARGPNLFSGYWPDGDRGPGVDGWFRTGDVGYFDPDGDLHLVDRANDLIIVNGFNVYPHEVERVLTQHAAVAEAAAVGVPDPRTGETVKAVVVRTPGADVTEDELRDYCARDLAKFKVPTVIEFTDHLPHSITGKLARKSLR